MLDARKFLRVMVGFGFVCMLFLQSYSSNYGSRTGSNKEIRSWLSSLEGRTLNVHLEAKKAYEHRYGMIRQLAELRSEVEQLSDAMREGVLMTGDSSPALRRKIRKIQLSNKDLLDEPQH